MKKAPVRRKHRLPVETYAVPGIAFHWTICTSGRRRFFADRALAEAIAATIRSHLAPHVDLYAFCIMPDHVHVICGTRFESQLAVIGRWKQIAHFAIRRVHARGGVWQRASYDTGVRFERTLQAQAEYVVANPVRAGLVPRWEEYVPLVWHAWMES
jgi:REP element-mobilizing transposase RayT